MKPIVVFRALKPTIDAMVEREGLARNYVAILNEAILPLTKAERRVVAARVQPLLITVDRCSSLRGCPKHTKMARF